MDKSTGGTRAARQDLRLWKVVNPFLKSFCLSCWTTRQLQAPWTPGRTVGWTVVYIGINSPKAKFWTHVKHVSHFSDFLRPRASQIKKLESFGTGAPAHIILKQVHLQFSHVFNICFNVRPATCTPGSCYSSLSYKYLLFLCVWCPCHGHRLRLCPEAGSIFQHANFKQFCHLQSSASDT